MPLYEYQCQQCQRTLEKRQKFADAPLTECPHCGGRLEKLISAPAVQFKGGGWYADGYASTKKSGGGSSESTGSTSSSSDSSAKTTTPAAPSAAPASSSSTSSTDKK